MFVLTIDQQGSRRVGDRVDRLLGHLEDRVVRDAPGVVRPFERTVGDEVQAVLDDPRLAVETALEVLRLGEWTVGLGAGAVDEPLPAAARAGSGPAFVLAREAVERAKSRTRPVPIAVEATHAPAGADCEAVLTLVGAIMARRTEQGWAVIDTLAALGDATQDAVAERLGITQQAVSQRLRTALWAEELAVRPAAARLLAEGDA
ncbi:SatD family protein [Actinotalea sp. C106]|uniref:SatD family protein n=1 Tax=Actinotalea sp. C106 TaxID=2908644 RepID=UPI0020289EF1|nr:SatD family protein [Actinotalea sp. C106]